MWRRSNLIILAIFTHSKFTNTKRPKINWCRNAVAALQLWEVFAILIKEWAPVVCEVFFFCVTSRVILVWKLQRGENFHRMLFRMQKLLALRILTVKSFMFLIVFFISNIFPKKNCDAIITLFSLQAHYRTNVT